ncbi:LytR/AlgR family response regulator transcription factor [Flagellimonas allohymeniacidonis]|uniref:Response regulator transcription factor n=1 Tax=Flagellimonas allohymeniacidonis TaxID=2517819 RepID=A0A4Q8QG26_9FLAO|nr:LytTR family DNA-binding domain-containing protein [Allomuricauda hymeniacidonis]TAI48844.1 response regulator transcription factor [Allomuricauda hymeniacidonis]
MMHCIVIDDEPLARECIISYVEQVDFLTCVGSGVTAMEIPKLLSNQKVDLLFLDVQMPVMNGLEYLKSNPEPPMTILTTAYPNYALEGFDLNVMDYLLKPISFNRFFTSATKAKRQYELLQQRSVSTLEEESGCFFIKCDGKYEKIFHEDILFVQAMQNYVIIQTTKRRYVSLLFLKNVEEKLDANAFLRVHKSYIVAIDKIEGVAQHELQIQSHRIPMSRNYKKEVLPKILGNKLWDGK